MKPIIKPYLRLRLLDGNVLLLGEDKMAKNIPLDAMLTEFMGLLDGTRTVDDIHETLSRRFPDLRYEEVQRSVDQLVAANLVEDDSRGAPADFGRQELDRYDRQLLFFSMFEGALDKYAYQRRLRESRVTILGCGGVGSHTLLNVACAGVGHIRVVDFDNVETSNLNRSFVFDEDDVGKPKTRALRERIGRLNPHLEYEFVDRKVAGKEDLYPLLAGVDFAVLCADSPYLKINRWFNEVCLELRVPYSLAGCSEIFGTVGPLTLPYETSCFECHGFDQTDPFEGPEFVVRANVRRTAPSFVPIIGSLASLNSLEIIKFLTGYAKPAILNRQLKIDYDTLQFEYVERPRKRDCVACGEEATTRGEAGIVGRALQRP